MVKRRHCIVCRFLVIVLAGDMSDEFMHRCLDVRDGVSAGILGIIDFDYIDYIHDRFKASLVFNLEINLSRRRKGRRRRRL